jgi:hypothetical protein
MVPLINALPPEERARLVRLITGSADADSSIYQARPPAGDEFSTDEEHLAWDGEGWENVG